MYVGSRDLASTPPAWLLQKTFNLASFPGLPLVGEEKAWGLLLAHVQELPEKLVIWILLCHLSYTIRILFVY